MSSAAVSSILVPLSGLTVSSRAVAYGIYVAKRLNIPLIGLYAGKPLEGSPTEEILVRNFHEECRHAGISPDLRKIPDLSAESITAAVNDPESTLLLIPQTNQEDTQTSLNHTPDIAMGSLTSPLMILPPQFLEIESMGLLYDGSGESDRALELAVTLSRGAVWPLTILLISDNQKRTADLSKQLEDYFEQNDADAPIDWITVVLGGQEEDATLQFIRDGSIELLVLAVTDQDCPRRRILRENPIPVIVAG